MKYQVFFGLVVLATILALSEAKKTRWFELDNYHFEHYVKEHGKQYSSVEEYSMRQRIFEDKLAEIKRHNQDPRQTYKKGINQFTDRTEEEFRRLLGYDMGIASASKAKRAESKFTYTATAPLPEAVDWRKSGVVTPVKDQGECGSCWSFSTAEVVESYFALASGQLAVLSEQQILDCTSNPQECGGTGGCQGGTSEVAFEQIIAMGGLSSEWTYPYTSWSGNNYQCQSSTSAFSPVAKLSDYVVLPSNQYDPVVTSLATTGPLSVALDASAWSSYEYGVFNHCNNTVPDIDHGVLLVGYGTDPQYGPYWLVRNSWTTGWGEDGYIRLQRSDPAPCGTDVTPADGTGCKNGPPQVTVCGDCGILYDTSYPIISY
jgi:cathepsin L